MKIPRLVAPLIVMALVAGVMFVGSGIAALAQADGPGEIVFTSDRSGNYEIYVLNPDTGLVSQLTNNPGSDIEPVWSPDGLSIAFVSDRDGDFELYQMNADGTNVRQLTNNLAEDREPRWQPGGEYIVYSSNVNGQWDLYSLTVDDLLVRQLTNDVADERGPGGDGSMVAEPGVPVQDATPRPGFGPEPDATVDTYQLNVRSSPGLGAQVVTVIPRDTPVDIIARRADNGWVQVNTPNNQTGWVATYLLQVNINLDGVPIINAAIIPAPPTATPTPTNTPIPQVIIEFWASTTEITAGDCVTLFWRVEGIQEVYYQGEGVVGQGSREECPATTTTYNLRVIRLDNVEDNRYITVVVNP
ncbi:MAG: SH3 domain-containing protein [Chloroflexi bacterium]|nr:SH3 domain-containing protein [Chloroflexota bacterium]